MYFRGEEFKKDFKDLLLLKVFFLFVLILVLIVIVLFYLVEKLKKSLMFFIICKIVVVNLNRVNIYFDKKIRFSNYFGNESYRVILELIVFELVI